MLATLFALPFLSLAVLAEPHGHSSFQRHHQVAKRAPSDVHLYEKKFSGARWSFYAAGQGACGGVNVESDFIVALNSEQYGSGYPGPQCFKMITMSLNGKTATAQIVDECPGCPYGGLDLSKGLFTHFASEDEGIVYGEWSFIDGNGGGGGGGGGGDEETTTKEPKPTKETWTWSPDPTTSKTKTKTTIEWTPEPTPEWTPEPTTESTSSTEETTSSSKTKTKKTSTWSEPTSSSSEWSSSSSSTPTSSAVATPTPTPTVIGGIELLGQAVLGMGNLMVNVAVAA